MDTLTDERLEREFKVTEEALNGIKIKIKKSNKSYRHAIKFLDTAKRYYEDARFFEKKNDLVNAFAAVCYAHAFLDIGALMGLFDVDDDQLFMVEKNYRKRH